MITEYHIKIKHNPGDFEVMQTALSLKNSQNIQKFYYTNLFWRGQTMLTLKMKKNPFLFSRSNPISGFTAQTMLSFRKLINHQRI